MPELVDAREIRCGQVVIIGMIRDGKVVRTPAEILRKNSLADTVTVCVYESRMLGVHYRPIDLKYSSILGIERGV